MLRDVERDDLDVARRGLDGHGLFGLDHLASDAGKPGLGFGDGERGHGHSHARDQTMVKPSPGPVVALRRCRRGARHASDSSATLTKASCSFAASTTTLTNSTTDTGFSR